MTPYIDSYYTRTLADRRQRSSLSGIEHADVCVVGAGLAGLTTALELVRAGRSVVLLDAQAVGWGASGRRRPTRRCSRAICRECLTAPARLTAQVCRVL